MSSFLKFFLSIAFFLNCTLNIPKTNSSEEKINNNFEYTDFEKQYILGPGDVVFIDFIGIDLLSKTYLVDAGGSMVLPEIGHFKAIDKTLFEAKKILVKKYSEFIINPQINLYLVSQKPINVLIKGEVNRPGLYTLNSENKYTNNGSNSSLANRYFLPGPKLFDGLQKGDGITLNADLSNISVIRKNAQINGGGKIKTNINLLSLLEEGDLAQNIPLRDGDVINVNRSENILLDQLLMTNKTNLAPKDIIVYVNGNVSSPGSKKIRQNSSLLEAISAAGGKRTNTGTIEFIRLNRNGKSTRRVFKFNSSALKGTKDNPLLIGGDIIVVNKNIVAKSTEMLDTIASPIISTYGLIKLFD